MESKSTSSPPSAEFKSVGSGWEVLLNVLAVCWFLGLAAIAYWVGRLFRALA
jgi:hypothetical protein